MFKPNKKEEVHDCISALIKKRAENIEEKEKLFNKLGINYDIMNAKCKKGHQFKMHRGIVRAY